MSRRTERVAEAIREVVATAVLFEVKDPRVMGVTVLAVEVGGDLRTAKVRVSVMGDEVKRRLAMHGLNSARGFLQSKIAKRLDLRFTPMLTLVEDDSVRKLAEMAKLLRDTGITPQDAEEGADAPADGSDPAPTDAGALRADAPAGTPAPAPAHD